MFSFFLVAAVSAGQPQPNCKEPQTQTDMTICSGRDYKTADGAMTRQYNVVAARMKRMDANLDRTYDKRPGYFAALLAGQRAWLRFREAHCVTEGYYARGGSMEPMLVNTCFEELTKQRTEQLRNLDKMYHQ